MIAAGGVDWSSILDSSKLSTEDDVLVFEDEYRPTLKASYCRRRWKRPTSEEDRG